MLLEKENRRLILFYRKESYTKQPLALSNLIYLFLTKGLLLNDFSLNLASKIFSVFSMVFVLLTYISCAHTHIYEVILTKMISFLGFYFG